MTNLQFLEVQSNAISGTIPTEVGLLKSLRLLSTTDCPFEGSVLPSEIGNLVMLGKTKSGGAQSRADDGVYYEILSNRKSLLPTEYLEIRDTSLVSVTIPTELGLITSLGKL